MCFEGVRTYETMSFLFGGWSPTTRGPPPATVRAPECTRRCQCQALVKKREKYLENRRKSCFISRFWSFFDEIFHRGSNKQTEHVLYLIPFGWIWMNLAKNRHDLPWGPNDASWLNHCQTCMKCSDWRTTQSYPEKACECWTYQWEINSLGENI